MAAPFYSKAQKWLTGRQNWEKRLMEWRQPGFRVIWMHCSSLGEFEQGRPLLEAIRSRYPNYKLLLSFYSPSGYEVRKNYTGADAVIYLPADTPRNAARFVAILQPEMALFVKYEFWYNLLHQLQKNKVPAFLVSGIFRKEQLFFKRYGSFFRTMLQSFSALFVQNAASLELVLSIPSPPPVIISGDTRFDRVNAIEKNWQPLPLIEKFIAGSEVLVAGSTWLSDDDLLARYARNNPEMKFIVAPHETDQERIRQLKSVYAHHLLYSELSENQVLPHGKNVLIIDNVGMLTQLYAYGHFCYVGGAFDSGGVHNVLEPAVFSKPVLFGPIYDKYAEAIELLHCGGAVVVRDYEEMELSFDRLRSDGNFSAVCAKASGKYVEERTGATIRILKYLEQNNFIRD